MANDIKLKIRYKAAGDAFKALIEKAGFSIEDAVNFLNGIRDSDVESVRHGRWKWGETGGAYCTAHKGEIEPRNYGYAYCPLCGALMDLEEVRK